MEALHAAAQNTRASSMGLKLATVGRRFRPGTTAAMQVNTKQGQSKKTERQNLSQVAPGK